MSTPLPHTASQSEVEQNTGLSREVLRKWEVRYQFPTPLRGKRGQRLYLQTDVHRLQLIARLLRYGNRPSKTVPLPLTALQEMLACREKDTGGATLEAGLLACLLPGCDPRMVYEYLDRLINENGLAKFVESLLPDFNNAVGLAWTSGHLGVHMEHHYSEAMRQTLYLWLAKLRPSEKVPRILITTPPGEQHVLGAMGLQVALALRGANCVSLGTQTPVDEVVQAVEDMDIGVVAISVSVCLPQQYVMEYLTTLRRALPGDCRMWAGGGGTNPLAARMSSGIEHFHAVDQAVAAWQLLTATDAHPPISDPA